MSEVYHKWSSRPDIETHWPVAYHSVTVRAASDHWWWAHYERGAAEEHPEAGASTWSKWVYRIKPGHGLEPLGEPGSPDPNAAEERELPPPCVACAPDGTWWRVSERCHLIGYGTDTRRLLAEVSASLDGDLTRAEQVISDGRGEQAWQEVLVGVERCHGRGARQALERRTRAVEIAQMPHTPHTQETTMSTDETSPHHWQSSGDLAARDDAPSNGSIWRRARSGMPRWAHYEKRPVEEVEGDWPPACKSVYRLRPGTTFEPLEVEEVEHVEHVEEVEEVEEVEHVEEVEEVEHVEEVEEVEHVEEVDVTERLDFLEAMLGAVAEGYGVEHVEDWGVEGLRDQIAEDFQRAQACDEARRRACAAEHDQNDWRKRAELAEAEAVDLAQEVKRLTARLTGATKETDAWREYYQGAKGRISGLAARVEQLTKDLEHATGQAEEVKRDLDQERRADEAAHHAEQVEQLRAELKRAEAQHVKEVRALKVQLRTVLFAADRWHDEHNSAPLWRVLYNLERRYGREE